MNNPNSNAGEALKAHPSFCCSVLRVALTFLLSWENPLPLISSVAGQSRIHRKIMVPGCEIHPKHVKDLSSHNEWVTTVDYNVQMSTSCFNLTGGPAQSKEPYDRAVKFGSVQAPL